jgi:hypothetical protein
MNVSKEFAMFGIGLIELAVLAAAGIIVAVFVAVQSKKR